MKAEELMIGDWVKVNDVKFPYPMQVDGLEKKGGSYYALFPKWELSVIVDKLEPIPITAEILVKNGFVCKEIYEKYEWSEGHIEIWIILGDTDEKQHVIHIDDWQHRIPICHHNIIAFVHELQHSLRQCRIKKEIRS